MCVSFLISIFKDSFDKYLNSVLCVFSCDVFAIICETLSWSGIG